jgi:hypothetical protein
VISEIKDLRISGFEDLKEFRIWRNSGFGGIQDLRI